MLNDLAEMINEEFELKGKDLEVACLVVGAALAETMATMKNQGLMSKDKLNSADCYNIANHFQSRLNKMNSGQNAN